MQTCAHDMGCVYLWALDCNHSEAVYCLQNPLYLQPDRQSCDVIVFPHGLQDNSIPQTAQSVHNYCPYNYKIPWVKVSVLIYSNFHSEVLFVSLKSGFY